MDQLPRLGKRELICLLLFTCNYVVSVWRGFLFPWVLGMGYVILLWHSLGLHIIILNTNSSSGADQFNLEKYLGVSDLSGMSVSSVFILRSETDQQKYLHVSTCHNVQKVYKSNRKAMNKNWSNQKANPTLKTKTGNK